MAQSMVIRVRPPVDLPPPEDTFWITGRGLVLTWGANPAPKDRPVKVNTNVWIDGASYFVTGIELHRPMVPVSHYRGPVGLLVRTQTKLPEGYYK